VFFFTPDEPEDLAELIIELCRNPRRRETQRANGRKYFMQHSWNQYRQKYLEIIRELSPANSG